MNNMNNIFINFGDDNNTWDLNTIKDVVSLVKVYAVAHHLEDVKLYRVEDNRWGDPVNQRFDIEIRYKDDNGCLIQQKLLILKGEILDGNAFHKRFEEFYPRKTA